MHKKYTFLSILFLKFINISFTGNLKVKNILGKEALWHLVFLIDY